MRLTIVTLALTLAASGPALAVSKSDYSKAADAAAAAQKAAHAAGGEWRDVGDLLKKSADAASGGDYAKAVKLAHEAEQQGKLGLMQAEAEAAKKDVHPSYLR